MLRAERLTKRFAAAGAPVTALDGVSVDLEPGARLGLTGPSGSGKSTLAATLGLLLCPDEGAVSVDGEPVTRWGVRAPRALRRRVQIIWQSPRTASDPRMRLRELVLAPLAANRALPPPPQRAELLDRAAADAGLTDELLDRHPHEVSDGQLQRACLARALILEPRYLICDEPTSMLDVSTQAAVLATIARAQAATGCGVLLITHDVALARHWCDPVLDLRDLTASRNGHPAP